MGFIVTLDDYFMGRNLSHPDELDDILRANAHATVARVNVMLQSAGLTHARVNSGWRPLSVNAAIPNASPRSRHLTCQAIDLQDTTGMLDDWCMRNLDRLAEFELWLEHPSATPGWCHVQTVPPRSGCRVFMP